jgi:hypothetical protein
MVHEVVLVVTHRAPPGLAVAVYPVIGDPPVEVGALQDTVARPFPAVAETPVGAPGAVAGVTALDGDEAGPAPAPLVAVTVNVYAVPFVKPETVNGLAEPVAVAPPGEAVTV